MKIPGINAAKLADTYTVTVQTDAGRTVTANLSALSYANSILTSNAYKDNETAKQAMAALYYYYHATAVYVGP